MNFYLVIVFLYTCLGNFPGGCFLPSFDKGLIDAFFRNQFVVGAMLHDSSVIHHKNLVGINEVLTELRDCTPQEKRHEYLQLIDEPEEKTDENGTITRTGLTYSDIMMTLRWYKVLPR